MTTADFTSVELPASVEAERAILGGNATENHNPAWVKIRNRRYSQMVGRDELFERRYEEKGAPEIGWDVCDRACASAAGL